MKIISGDRISMVSNFLLFIGCILMIVPLLIFIVQFNKIDALAPILTPFVMAGAFLTFLSIVIKVRKKK